MRNLLIFMTLLLAMDSIAGTCTSISRTNNSPNTILTSTKYNSDVNTVYTHTNDLDGGCITDDTIEKAALNTTEFAAFFNGIHQGCKSTYSDDATISVGKCILGLNGNFVKTTAANTETWGCTGCSSEASDTVYYVYSKSDSDGTTLTLLLLTGGPNEDGFDSSTNKVLGRFYNDASSNINQYSVDQWVVNGFVAQPSAPASYSPAILGFGTVAASSFHWYRDGASVVIHGKFTAGTPTAVEAQIPLPAGLTVSSTHGSLEVVGAAVRDSPTAGVFHMLVTPGDSFINVGLQASATAGLAALNGNGLLAAGNKLSFTVRLTVTEFEY